MTKPMLDNPFSKEIFPNIQSKPPLVQLKAISSRPTACYLGEETNTHLAKTSFQVAVESDKVSSQPPFLQSKQPQFPQLLLHWSLLKGANMGLLHLARLLSSEVGEEDWDNGWSELGEDLSYEGAGEMTGGEQ